MNYLNWQVNGSLFTKEIKLVLEKMKKSCIIYMNQLELVIMTQVQPKLAGKLPAIFD